MIDTFFFFVCFLYMLDIYVLGLNQILSFLII